MAEWRASVIVLSYEWRNGAQIMNVAEWRANYEWRNGAQIVIVRACGKVEMQGNVLPLLFDCCP